MIYTSVSASILGLVGGTVVEGESEQLGGVGHLVLVNVPLAPGTVLQMQM